MYRMISALLKAAFLHVATRTSCQRFAGNRIVPEQIIGNLGKEWNVGPRRVFVKAYAKHHGYLSLRNECAWERIVSDYLQYCSSYHRWLPYYVLRAAYPDVKTE